jgi:hypothetical protein
MKTFWFRNRRGHVLGMVLIAVAGLAGCADKAQKVTIHGTVSYNGKPLNSGILKIVGAEGAYTAATIQADGTFVLTDVAPGEVTVAVVEAPQGSRSSSGEQRKSSPPSLPKKFSNPTTSGLKYTITPETRELPIEIQ